MKKRFLKQVCSLCVCGLFLNACSLSYDELPNIRINQRCQAPVITYEFGSIKRGDYDDLKLSYEDIQAKIEASLNGSGCFKKTQELNNAYKHYRLDAVFGTITKHNKQGGFWSSQTTDTLIFEVQLAFNRIDETRVFYGKSSIQNDADQYLKIFGQESTLNVNQIQITLRNALNSATNEATKSFLQEKQNF